MSNELCLPIEKMIKFITFLPVQTPWNWIHCHLMSTEGWHVCRSFDTMNTSLYWELDIRLVLIPCTLLSEGQKKIHVVFMGTCFKSSVHMMWDFPAFPSSKALWRRLMFTILTVIWFIISWSMNRPGGGLCRRPSRFRPPIRASHCCKETVRTSGLYFLRRRHKFKKIVKNPSGNHPTEKHHVWNQHDCKLWATMTWGKLSVPVMTWKEDVNQPPWEYHFAQHQWDSEG